MPFRITTFGITMVSIMTLGLMIFSITTLSIIITRHKRNSSQQQSARPCCVCYEVLHYNKDDTINNNQHCYAECGNAMCSCVESVIILNALCWLIRHWRGQLWKKDNYIPLHWNDHHTVPLMSNTAKFWKSLK